MPKKLKSSELQMDSTKKRKNVKKKKIENFNIKELIVIVIITAIISFCMGLSIKIEPKQTDLSHYEKELLNNYEYILDNYYKEVEARDLVNAAVKGMINYLDDPYSNYINIDQLEDFNLLINGEYEGIGIQVAYKNDWPTVFYVYPNSPADQAGLQPNDILIEIDGTSLSGKKIEDVKTLIIDSGENEFEIIFKRDTEEHKVKLKIDTVIIDSVESKVYEENDKKIGYLKLNNFATNSYEQFEKILLNLENEEKIDSLIIDLRDNTGGQLQAVDDIVSLFVKKGEVIYQMKEKDKITKYYSHGDKTRNYPIVVLTNENSASASELMTSALKEIYGATTIGIKTYGKGTAQEIITLDNGEQYKFTTKEWLTAKGDSIDGVGIEPNIEIFQIDEYYENPVEDNDTQLRAAIEFLSK